MLLMNNVVPDDDDDDEGEVAQSDSPMVMGTAQQQVTDSSQRSVTATNTALVKVLPDTYQPPPYNQPQYPSPHTTATPTTYQYAQQATPYVPPPDSLSYGAPPPGSVPYGAPPPGSVPYGAPPPGSVPYGAPPPGSVPYGAPPPPSQDYYGYQSSPQSSHRPPPSPPSTYTANPVVKSAPEVNRSTKPVTSALTSLGTKSLPSSIHMCKLSTVHSFLFTVFSDVHTTHALLNLFSVNCMTLVSEGLYLVTVHSNLQAT